MEDDDVFVVSVPEPEMYWFKLSHQLYEVDGALYDGYCIYQTLGRHDLTCDDDDDLACAVNYDNPNWYQTVVADLAELGAVGNDTMTAAEIYELAAKTVNDFIEMDCHSGDAMMEWPNQFYL